MGHDIFITILLICLFYALYLCFLTNFSMYFDTQFVFSISFLQLITFLQKLFHFNIHWEMSISKACHKMLFIILAFISQCYCLWGIFSPFPEWKFALKNSKIYFRLLIVLLPITQTSVKWIKKKKAEAKRIFCMDIRFSFQEMWKFSLLKVTQAHKQPVKK